MTRWVVVGAGTAGCVVTALLSARPDAEVVLIESGTATSTPPLSVFDAMAVPGRLVDGPVLRGQGLGGSSAVNGMIAVVAAGESGPDVALPRATATDDELGPIDRALLVAAPGAVRVPLAMRGGRRVTTADSYLDATVQARVEILTGDRVDRIAVVGDRAVGVVLASGVEVPAHRVVVCAGAVGSPALLLASGLGGAAVGRNLQNHPGLPVTLHLRDGVDVDRHGLATAVTWRAETDVEIVALNHLGPDEPGRAMLLVGAMAPTGRGSVTLGADGTPVVEPVASDQDRVRLGVGLRRVEELLAHPAFAAIVDRVEVGQAPAGFHHATSTCAMGAVVDGRGSVTATAGLAVVDASVFPTIPTTHPYLPTVVLAETLGAVL